MEHSFQPSTLSYLDAVVQEIQNAEQTQEIRLPDGMPDVGRILSAWGQVILRSKEWRSDSISFSGGMMIWVLYAPEDGSPEQCIDAWIPFQMRWDLPEGTAEGDIRIRCLPRFVDARTVSPRKIMVRAGLAAMGEAYVPRTAEVFSPGQVPQGTQLLTSTYPVRMYREAGEKVFEMDETLTLPDSVPGMEQIIYFRLNPKITDRKVLGSKAVFRGNGNLHVLYRSEEGQLHSWDFDLPFSQYAELNQEHSSDAQMDVVLLPVSLELDLDGEGQLRFKGNLAAQYVITDKMLLQLVEDAYDPIRELGIRSEELELPTVLESRRENIYGEHTLTAEANLAVDSSFLPDFPRQRPRENGVDLEMPGTFQVLYYGEDGILRSGTARWEGQQHVAADERSQIQMLPTPAEPTAIAGNGQILMKAELPMEMTTTTRQRLPMVTGVAVGDVKGKDPNRPTLILRRTGASRLWDIAKNTGSTVEAIRRANGISEEPAPGQMLLIPVP